MQRGLAPILIIVGVLLLSVGVLGVYMLATKPQTPIYMTPLPAPTPAASDQTVNWKTYTDPKFGFSIKHPPEYSIIHPEDEPNTVNIINESATYYGTIFTVIENPKQQTISVWLKENKYNSIVTSTDERGTTSKSPSEKDIKLTQLQVSAQTAVKLEYVEDSTYCKVELLGQCGSMLYIQYPDNKKIMSITNIGDAMLSTFKFTQ